MDDFDNSFNMLLDIRNKEFDWFDNPYISPQIYEFDESYVIKQSEVKFKICSLEDKLKYMDPTAASFYHNSLCFDDKKKIYLNGNWYKKIF